MDHCSTVVRVRRLGEALLDLVVPQQCPGCRRPGSAWCTACATAVRGGVRPLDGDLRGAAAGDHAGPLGPAVVAFKDAGQRRLAGPLGRALADAVRAGIQAEGLGPPGRRVPTLWLIPVPSRPAARRHRGGDHMAVLAARAAADLRRTGWTAHRCRLLAHAAASRDQVGLDRSQRRANLAGTLRAVAAPPPGVLVVVDDVTTTGATLAEAVRALREVREPGAGLADGPVLVATITAATLLRGHASGTPDH